MQQLLVVARRCAPMRCCAALAAADIEARLAALTGKAPPRVCQPVSTLHGRHCRAGSESLPQALQRLLDAAERHVHAARTCGASMSSSTSGARSRGSSTPCRCSSSWPSSCATRRRERAGAAAAGAAPPRLGVPLDAAQLGAVRRLVRRAAALEQGLQPHGHHRARRRSSRITCSIR